MKENFVVNPVMQTFDLLDLQEASLTCKRIIQNQNNKCRRNQSTNQLRRGGENGYKAKRKQNRLAGTLIGTKLAEQKKEHFTVEALTKLIGNDVNGDDSLSRKYKKPNLTSEEKTKLRDILGYEQAMKYI